MKETDISKICKGQILIIKDQLLRNNLNQKIYGLKRQFTGLYDTIKYPMFCRKSHYTRL